MLVTIGKDSYDKMWSEFNKNRVIEQPPKDAISVRQYATKYKTSIDFAYTLLERGVTQGELVCKKYRVINHNNKSCNVKFYSLVKPRRQK